MNMARGSHGLFGVLLEPAITYPSTPCGRPPLERPYGRFRGSCPQGRVPAAVCYPLGHPTPYAFVLTLTASLTRGMSPVLQTRVEFVVDHLFALVVAFHVLARQDVVDVFGAGRHTLHVGKSHFRLDGALTAFGVVGCDTLYWWISESGMN
jgi:hypothetical protein